MIETKLFTILPDYVCTPDGMEIDREGNLIVSCPNYAEDSYKGCVIKIDKNKNISKWFDVPVHPETGIARNMGIAFDGDYNIYICDNQGWSGKEELAFKGRILKITADEEGITSWKVVADGMEHPNGIRIMDGYMYVTQSCMTKEKHPSGHLVSGVYRFGLDEENIHITNTLEDKHLFTTFITNNEACQYGADGIVFGRDGNLYVGNFGDGAVHRITFAADGSCAENIVFAKDETQLKSTDGMICDEKGNIYVADFSDNAIVKIDMDGLVERIAQSPDCNGLEGGLDQPGEPIIWQGRIVASCFDLVTDEGKVNTQHEMPATMAELELPLNSKTVTKKQLQGMIDHTFLKAFATDKDFDKLCLEASENHFAMVAINSVPVQYCKELLKDTGVHVGAAISFPLGQTAVEVKVYEAEQAIRQGADEIDYVINIGQLKQGNLSYIREEMEAMVAVCHKNDIVCKVIFENCYLTKEEIAQAAQIAKEVKPDFIKTSTGFGTSGAKADDVALMKKIVGNAVKVKAAGGINDWETCSKMIDAGAERIGTSNSITIVDEFIAVK